MNSIFPLFFLSSFDFTHETYFQPVIYLFHSYSLNLCFPIHFFFVLFKFFSSIIFTRELLPHFFMPTYPSTHLFSTINNSSLISFFIYPQMYWSVTLSCTFFLLYQPHTRPFFLPFLTLKSSPSPHVLKLLSLTQLTAFTHALNPL